MLDFLRAAMSQLEWGPSMETAYRTGQNVNGGKLENNILVQGIDLSYAILPWSMTLDSGPEGQPDPLTQLREKFQRDLSFWELLGFSAGREPRAKAHARRPRNHEVTGRVETTTCP